MLLTKQSIHGAIWGILIGIAASACGALAPRPDKPIMKWWFLDGREHNALIRRKCPPGQTKDCPIEEKKSFAEADGYFSAEARKVQALLDYMKSLERLAEQCKQNVVSSQAVSQVQDDSLDIENLPRP